MSIARYVLSFSDKQALRLQQILSTVCVCVCAGLCVRVRACMCVCERGGGVAV